MNRALVLIGFLAAAGAVAAYSKQAEEQQGEQAQVFTVPGPAASSGVSSAPLPAARTSSKPHIPADRVSLIRELQRELKRVGCYSGEINGVWTTSSRLAMKSFTDAANASLPIDNPDDVLLSLVRGHHEPACAATCSSGQVLNEKGRCGITASTVLEAVPSKGETASDPSPGLSSAVAPAAAGAAVLAGSAVIGKVQTDTSGPEASRPRVTPEDDAPASKRLNRRARHGRPVPRERVYKRRSRRYSNSPRPPKFVRNVLRAFGIR